ncbi:hypothetical protein ACS0PU_011628 [Formica fusca]
MKKEVDEIENKQLEVVSTKTNENDITGKDEIKDANAQQLLQFWAGDDMVHLQDGIFCKQKILDYAIGSSHKASHVARKLLEGVFHESALLHCTYTGQAPRAMGITNEKGMVSCLHNKTKNTILTFAKDLAKQRGWMEQTDEKIRQAMSQRLGEIKRDRKKLK